MAKILRANCVCMFGLFKSTIKIRTRSSIQPEFKFKVKWWSITIFVLPHYEANCDELLTTFPFSFEHLFHMVAAFVPKISNEWLTSTHIHIPFSHYNMYNLCIYGIEMLINNVMAFRSSLFTGYQSHERLVTFSFPNKGLTSHNLNIHQVCVQERFVIPDHSIESS